jgi:hypothetical protein
VAIGPDVKRAIARGDGAYIGSQVGSPRWTRAAVFGWRSGSEVPPEAARRILAAQLEQDMAPNLVASSGEMRTGIAKRTAALWAILGIRHRETCASWKRSVVCSIRLGF